MIKPISTRTLRNVEWVQCYEYKGKDNAFKVYASSEIKDFTIVHDFKKGSRTKITYRVNGRSTDTPAVAVRWWNEAFYGKKGTDAGKPKGDKSGSARARV